MFIHPFLAGSLVAAGAFTGGLIVVALKLFFHRTHLMNEIRAIGLLPVLNKLYLMSGILNSNVQNQNERPNKTYR